jgi:hypothetical protein
VDVPRESADGVGRLAIEAGQSTIGHHFDTWYRDVRGSSYKWEMFRTHGWW